MDGRKSQRMLVLSTVAFTVCFAAWMINGVLVTYLVDLGLQSWTKSQMGWLIGIPVLTGATMRLPLGVLTDKYGGRAVFTVTMLLSALPMYLLSYAQHYWEFFLASLGFGLTGATFAVGVAYVSIWYPKEKQGFALGIFGIGTAGTAITALGAPLVLKLLAGDGATVDSWRMLPKLYAVALIITAIVFCLFTESKKPEVSHKVRLAKRLEPLRDIRVWRFGLYYFFTFGGFVAVSQWLIPYYVNVYGESVATAGAFAAAFSLPTGLFRAFGGWLADSFGARALMYGTLSTSILFLILLLPPRMELQAPGQGVLADRAGVVSAVSPQEIVIGDDRYQLNTPSKDPSQEVEARVGIHTTMDEEGFFALPMASFSQQAVVQVGDDVTKKQVLARGVTRIYFQANIWIFSLFVLIVGIAMGIGSGAIYKHIPSYFPENVGVVGGLVGVLGGLGGFFGPIIFGCLLDITGIWTTCWLFLLLIALACLLWMHTAIRRSRKRREPLLARAIEDPGQT